MIDDLDQKTLEFERRWWKYPGAKDAAIREEFDESPVRYYQRLNALIDRPEAAEYDVLTVKRLRRLRDQRAERRAARSGPA
jgi:uncharacterized protein DUF3263